MDGPTRLEMISSRFSLQRGTVAIQVLYIIEAPHAPS